MNLSRLTKLARAKYGDKAVVRHNPKAPDAAQKAILREQSLARTARLRQLREEDAAAGDVQAALLAAARFAVDVDGDEPSWSRLRAAVEAAEGVAARKAEARDLEEARRRCNLHVFRFEVAVNLGWCWSVKHRADTAEELAGKLAGEAAGVEP